MEQQKDRKDADQPDEVENGEPEGDEESLSLEEAPPPPPRPIDKEGETFGRISIAMSSFASSGKGKEISRSDIPVPEAHKKK